MPRTILPAHYRRYREIARVVARHGFGWLLDELRPAAVPHLPWHRYRHDTGQEHTRPERTRRMLEDLGPTYIKLGQVLSTRPDLIPPEYVQEFTKLQDKVPAGDWDPIERVLKAEFGAPAAELFAEFDTHPLAGASIGQVYRARLKDGTPVVVKVRRPEAETRVEEDLAVLADLARLVTRHSSLGERYDIEGWVEEFSAALRDELDYTREAHNAERIRHNLAGDPAFVIPRVHWRFTTHCVLTMDEITGVKILDFAALDAAGLDRQKLAARCARLVITQVFEHGFFHADPHPGNFFVMPDGAIGLIDYGMVGKLDDGVRAALLRMAMAITRRDEDLLVEELLSLGAAHARVDRPALRRDLGRFVEEATVESVGVIGAGRFFYRLAAIAQKHSLQLPRDFMLLARVIAMDEGLGSALDPNFHLLEFAQPYLKRYWLETFRPENVASRAKTDALDWVEVGRGLPRRIRRLLGELERGEIVLTNRLEDAGELIRSFQQAANRISMSVLVASLIVGLSVLTAVFHPGGYATLGHLALRLMLSAVVVFGLWLLVSIFRSGR